jgi:hypothetical protein
MAAVVDLPPDAASDPAEIHITARESMTGTTTPLGR